MKKLVLLTLFILTALGSFAQNQPAKGHAKIIGAVIDAETNQPVEFANIALIDPVTNKPIDGSVCDDKGKFTIAKVAAGTYTVSISFIGYETQNIEKITVPDKNDELSLGIIKLAASTKMLNEVVVEGQKSMIEERVDRTIYNAENDATTKGGDATDVLKRVPMLSVDMDGNVSLRGSQNIRVLINNKPSTIMASSVADALKQIPADQIKSVEVITSPSAKYDAEGSGGIINIITKKNTLEGATLNIDAGVGLRGSNLGLNGNYRKGKMGFSLGGFGRTNYNTPGGFENSQLTKDSLGNDVYNVQTADTRNNGIFGNYTLGWDYDIDKKNSLAASVRFGARNNKSYQDDLYTTNTVSGSNLRDVVTNDVNETVDVNLTYTHLYDKPQREFSFLALYSRNNRNNDIQNVTKEKDEVAYSKGSYKNLNDSYNQEITVQADYQTPIGTNQLIELGAKDIIRTAVSDYISLYDSVGNGTYKPSTNAQFSNNLNYDQNIIAGYLSYTLTTKSGYSLKAGARYEYTTINAYTQTESNIDIPSYGVLVPSVNLSKKLKEGTVKVAYNRRVQRPSIQYLNPNIQSSNQLNLTKGNPELNPEYTNNYELSYSTFKKGTSINLTTFVRNTTGSIQSVRNNTDDGRILTTYENIGIENAYGASLFLGVNLGKFTLNGGTDTYYSVLNNNQGTKNEGWVISGRAFGSYDLGSGWGIQFFGFGRGKRVQLQGTQGSFRMYSLGVKKDLKDKRGSVGIGAENFFTPSLKIKNEIITPDITQHSTNIMHTMSFRVNFSYRLGKMSVDSKPRRSKKSINNDDLKDGGGDGGGSQADGGGQGQQRSGGGGFTPQGNGTRPAAAAGAAKVVAGDPAAIVDPVGIWNYTVESPQGGSGVLTLVKEGDKLTGKIKNNQFNRENDLSALSLVGNELSFSYEVSFGGNTMQIQVKAIITGDDLSGNMAVGTFGTYPIKAVRAK